MPLPATFPLRSTAASAAAAGLVLSLAACGQASSPAAEKLSTATARTDLPSAHVHGLTVNGKTGQVLLAAHEGLFDVSNQPAVKIGPANDLMGFTAAMDEGVFYASGHPGQGSDLPDPAGLIKTSDGGKTWEQVSRQNQSDFHALATTKSGIVAFDGTLRTSADGKNWKSVDTGFIPAALAGNPHDDTVLATTTAGVQRSTDGGKTWALIRSGPVIQFAAFASAREAIGIEPGGAVHYSSDGGATWTRKGAIAAQVQAIAATAGSVGKPRIWAATLDGLHVSTDGGATFRPADGA